MKHLKLFENFIEYDDVFEALYGLEISSVKFVNNGSPIIGKSVQTIEELQKLLNSVSDFINSTIGFTLEYNGYDAIKLFFDPQTKILIGYNYCGHRPNDSDWDKFELILRNFENLKIRLNRRERRPGDLQELHFDTLKKMLRTNWDWNVNK